MPPKIVSKTYAFTTIASMHGAYGTKASSQDEFNAFMGTIALNHGEYGVWNLPVTTEKDWSGDPIEVHTKIVGIYSFSRDFLDKATRKPCDEDKGLIGFWTVVVKTDVSGGGSLYCCHKHPNVYATPNE